MLGLSANLNYYLFNGNVDLRKGIFRLCESIRKRCHLTRAMHPMYICSCPVTGRSLRYFITNAVLCALRETSCHGKVQETCV